MTEMEDMELWDDFENIEDLSNCSDDGDNENEQLDVSELEPKVGMEFVGQDELCEFYKKYSMAMGFPWRKRASRKNVEGIVRSITLQCSRGGRHKNTSQNPLKPQASYRIGCTAYLTAKLVNGRWHISQIALEHNHQMSPSKSRFFRCNRQISAHVFDSSNHYKCWTGCSCGEVPLIPHWFLRLLRWLLLQRGLSDCSGCSYLRFLRLLLGSSNIGCSNLVPHVALVSKPQTYI